MECSRWEREPEPEPEPEPELEPEPEPEPEDSSNQAGVPAEDVAGAETRPDRRKDFLESGQSGGGSFSFSKEGEATAEEAAEEGGEASEPHAAAEEDRS